MCRGEGRRLADRLGEVNIELLTRAEFSEKVGVVDGHGEFGVGRELGIGVVLVQSVSGIAGRLADSGELELVRGFREGNRDEFEFGAHSAGLRGGNVIDVHGRCVGGV